MRILFLSDNFPPEVNAPAGRTFEHCRRRAAALAQSLGLQGKIADWKALIKEIVEGCNLRRAQDGTYYEK